MRVAAYNQMFGLDGRSLWGNLLGHWLVHRQESPERVHRRASLHPTVELLEGSNADMVAICEVLQGQERRLDALLREAGYAYVSYGAGHRTRFSSLRVKVAMASRHPFRDVGVSGFPVTDGIGGGGGLVHCRLPAPRWDVIAVHMASSRRTDLYRRQWDFLGPRLRGADRLVLLGDFNLTHAQLKARFSASLCGLTLASEEIRTCSMTPVFDLFVQADIDHIFVKGIAADGAGSLAGGSDHKLVYADLEGS